MKINQFDLYLIKDSDFLDVNNLDVAMKFSSVKIPKMLDFILYENKILGQPYYSTNNWEYQKFEDRHQIYKSSFKSDSKTKYIVLNGIDTLAEIYVNGILVGKTNNCYLPFTFKLDNLKKNNELIIHIFPSVIEGLKHDFSDIINVGKYNYESLYIRKPGSSFGWDILPRTALGGIYKDIELIDQLDAIEDIQIVASTVNKDRSVLEFNISSRISNASCIITGQCNDSKFEVLCKDKCEVEITNPYLWTLRGYGKQYLYRINVKLVKNNEVLQEKTIKYGIRKIELKRSSIVKQKGCFEFYINNEKVFLFGSNWVPTEAINHVDNKRGLKALKMLKDLGCNALRIWGGGTYETDEFYDWCDENGFFIWQDFMMACATYPQTIEFQNMLRVEALSIVKRLRNHCSICLWAGDNENDLASFYWSKQNRDPNLNCLTRKVLPEVLNEYDGTRPYLPSSPYIDEIAKDSVGFQLSEDHLWGPRDYFKGDFYTKSNPYFVSETGYHGLNSVRSLNKFMKTTWPLFGKDGMPTKEYLCHATSVKDDANSPYNYRIKLMSDQVDTLFIDKIDNVSDFSVASQISQAEAMKFFIEKIRMNPKRNGGIIWWNILDGWPQISDAVVDYYFSKKIAYSYIKRSQQKNLFMMDENDSEINLYLTSQDNQIHSFQYKIIDGYTHKEICNGSATNTPFDCVKISTIKKTESKQFLIIKYCDDMGKRYLNTFHTNVIKIKFNDYVRVMKKYKLN